jgi:hypothetical protein
MRKGRSTAARTPKKPADSEAGAALARKFAIKLFDRDEGEAANWKLIAETLFKAAFDALDRSPDDASRVALLRRVHVGSYDRLTVESWGQGNASPDGPERGRACRFAVIGAGGCRCLQGNFLNARYDFPPVAVRSITPGTRRPPRQIRNWQAGPLGFRAWASSPQTWIMTPSCTWLGVLSCCRLGSAIWQ